MRFVKSFKFSHNKPFFDLNESDYGVILLEYYVQNFAVCLSTKVLEITLQYQKEIENPLFLRRLKTVELVLVRNLTFCYSSTVDDFCPSPCLQSTVFL